MALLGAIVVLAGAVGPAVTAGAATARRDPHQLRLNQVQMIGTHNSYHVEPPPETYEALVKVAPTLDDLAFTHPPLRDQLERGVRQLELDVYADPDGTLWSPFGTKGFKVFHMDTIDTGSTCPVFVDCLRAVKRWSDAHPGHLPVTILVEPRETTSLPAPPNPLPFTPEIFDALDAEVRSVFEPRDLVTPDDVRGKRPTLEAAVRRDGWPTLAEARGRVMFLLDKGRAAYLVGHPNLEGRVFFTPSRPGQPDAAFVKRNDPRGETQARIVRLVDQGYLVRTRADEAVTTPRSGDVTQRDAAFASGAQLVSTDYPEPGLATRWGSDYVVRFPGAVLVRCNPVTAPPWCRQRMVREPIHR